MRSAQDGAGETEGGCTMTKEEEEEEEKPGVESGACEEEEEEGVVSSNVAWNGTEKG